MHSFPVGLDRRSACLAFGLVYLFKRVAEIARSVMSWSRAQSIAAVIKRV